MVVGGPQDHQAPFVINDRSTRRVKAVLSHHVERAWRLLLTAVRAKVVLDTGAGVTFDRCHNRHRLWRSTLALAFVCMEDLLPDYRSANLALVSYHTRNAYIIQTSELGIVLDQQFSICI